MGMIYKRGRVFWIKYYRGGKPIRESTGTTASGFIRHLLEQHFNPITAVKKGR